jgi:CRISPR-associated protein Cas2
MRRAYVVCYDIADPKRWREIHKIMLAYGDPLQLSVFLCFLSDVERERMLIRLRSAMNRAEDALAVADLGPADGRKLPLETYGTVRLKEGRRVVVV